MKLNDQLAVNCSNETSQLAEAASPFNLTANGQSKAPVSDRRFLRNETVPCISAAAAQIRPANINLTAKPGKRVRQMNGTAISQLAPTLAS